ncbi:ATP-binding cassette domain-containing protein [Fulvimarina sp. 2208YS6-2-32]|uniref:ATP-binding cassette domain-containing protein n=1 Tax=Fulvimarina uroteuthidis TaxID=3098149 RepID=A0ABU5HX10_9HYPH|nr:ATP-binding cassette domain-containing protein [Fulvimarina sp. 2208YS6-2-32]MDY8107671.1 ATP-binding cassette domain-containing protein [Fulvimarina sp. 2208YS6-2-32]
MRPYSPRERGLRLADVAIRLDGRTLIEIDRLIAPGDVLTVMGPSGSGKSTLFALIAGFLDPAFASEGRVFLDGEAIDEKRPERRSVGLLFQDALLFPHMSVGANLLFALKRDARGQAARRERAGAMLARVGLEGLFDRDPATLSGGQAARVALARTLLAEPRALLLDEPFSRLDAPLRTAMRELVFGLVRERAIPALLVTHDREDAEAAGGPLVELVPRRS